MFSKQGSHNRQVIKLDEAARGLFVIISVPNCFTKSQTLAHQDLFVQKKSAEGQSNLALQAGRDGQTEEILQELLQAIHKEEEEQKATQKAGPEVARRGH